jgi:hypothetical protein
VNARLGRGAFLPLFAMLDILSGAQPLMVDVRQSGSRSVQSPVTVTPDGCG